MAGKKRAEALPKIVYGCQRVRSYAGGSLEEAIRGYWRRRMRVLEDLDQVVLRVVGKDSSRGEGQRGQKGFFPVSSSQISGTEFLLEVPVPKIIGARTEARANEDLGLSLEHELIHIANILTDPRSGDPFAQRNWFWLDEAIANIYTYFESCDAFEEQELHPKPTKARDGKSNGMMVRRLPGLAGCCDENAIWLSDYANIAPFIRRWDPDDAVQKLWRLPAAKPFDAVLDLLGEPGLQELMSRFFMNCFRQFQSLDEAARHMLKAENEWSLLPDEFLLGGYPSSSADNIVEIQWHGGEGMEVLAEEAATSRYGSSQSWRKVAVTQATESEKATFELGRGFEASFLLRPRQAHTQRSMTAIAPVHVTIARQPRIIARPIHTIL